jgi:hypothetical protein
LFATTSTGSPKNIVDDVRVCIFLVAAAATGERKNCPLSRPPQPFSRGPIRQKFHHMQVTVALSDVWVR